VERVVIRPRWMRSNEIEAPKEERDRAINGRQLTR
jgi:hypothetical protein